MQSMLEKQKLKYYDTRIASPPALLQTRNGKKYQWNSLIGYTC